MSFVICKIENDVGTIVLNDPRHLNALSKELISDIITSLDKFEAKKVRAAVIRAKKGSKVWSAGHDVKELPTGKIDPLTYYDPLRKVVRAIQSTHYPVIAHIEGSVWGGACELIMSCDMIYASLDSTFAITPAKLGIPYNLTGILNFMKNISIPILKELIFTAKPTSARRAEMIGMITRAVETSELDDMINKRLDYIIHNAPLAISVMKEEMRVLSESSPLNPEAFERIQGGRRIVYNSEDYKEGLTAFFEKRKPVFKGE
ncbi:MAG: methylmalonyl-CoA decarboxylase [bacterium]|nr:methylmalonyl-CoA decarboxylase [bacterium]